MKILALLLVISSTLFSASPIYNIEDFGAVPNSGIPCTKSIQSAIQHCSEKGGGTVLIPQGEFISGTIFLDDNVNLHLSAGAVLLGSPDLNDYTVNGNSYGLIRAWRKKNISITGQGEMNGNGTIFFDPEKPHVGSDFDRQYTHQGEKYMSFANGIGDGPFSYENRPHMLVVLLRCEDVVIEDVTFRDSPNWTFRIGDCDGVHVRGINIYNNLLVPNSDGIHCTTSRNVRISDCDIRCGDDAIIVTGFGDDISVGRGNRPSRPYNDRLIGNKIGVAENIVVTNCVLQSRSSGIRVGYGTNDMRNCIFSNLVIYDSNRGIGVFARDAGSIENILFSNITIQTRLHTGHWWGNGEPVHVSAIAQNNDVPVGSIKNVRFKNIIAKSEAGILVYGEKPELVQDIVFDDVQLDIVIGEHSETYGGNFDLRPVADLRDAIFQHDIAGLYAENAMDVRIENFKLTTPKKLPSFFTAGVECHNVEHLNLNDIDFSGSKFTGKKAIRLVDCKVVEK